MYDYNMLEADIKTLNPIITEVNVIGQSVMGRNIYCLKIGRGKTNILLTGAHHGLEYITSLFLMRFIKMYEDSAIEGKEMLGYNIRNLYKSFTIYVMPMVNPDGVDVAINGLDITNKYHRDLISKVGIHGFRKVWQANINGVDLNHNYNAMWHNTVEKPSPTLYGGEYAESEPETKAVCDFLRGNEIEVLMCFHSQGKEIYYDYDGENEVDAEILAEKMAAVSGYKLSEPSGTAAYGGCKDWFTREFGKTGFTIEMGKGKNPLPSSCIDEVFTDNASIILACLDEIKKETFLHKNT